MWGVWGQTSQPLCSARRFLLCVFDTPTCSSLIAVHFDPLWLILALAHLPSFVPNPTHTVSTCPPHAVPLLRRISNAHTYMHVRATLGYQTQQHAGDQLRLAPCSHCALCLRASGRWLVDGWWERAGARARDSQAGRTRHSEQQPWRLAATHAAHCNADDELCSSRRSPRRLTTTTASSGTQDGVMPTYSSALAARAGLSMGIMRAGAQSQGRAD